jgi:4-diphosphocytidyl-2-C-methyl-D-erythritol kinase
MNSIAEGLRRGRFQLTAWSKLNVSLKVIRRRDDGYHELDSLVVPLELADTLVVEGTEDASSLSVEFSPELLPYANGLENDLQDFTTTTFGKACRWWDQFFDASLRVRIHLRKKIPWGAGLGGGSADAAALLRLFAFLARGTTRDAYSHEELRSIAHHVGADVPMLLTPRPYRVTGVGEVLRPWKNAGTLTNRVVALLWPRVALPTKAIFSRYSASGAVESYPPHDQEHVVVGMNSLERVAGDLLPLIRTLIATARKQGFNECGMTGSGSVVYIFCPLTMDDEEFLKSVKEYCRRSELSLFISRTLESPSTSILKLL